MALCFSVIWVLISGLVKSFGLSEWNLQADVYISICASITDDRTDNIPLSTCCAPLIKKVVQVQYQATQVIVFSVSCQTL